VTAGIAGNLGLIPGGPIFVFYYLATQHPVAVQRASIVVGVTVIVLAMLIAMVIEGIYDPPTIARCAAIVRLFLAGVVVGERLTLALPTVWFKRITYGLLLASGLATLVL